jgi:hypothetical protein
MISKNSDISLMAADTSKDYIDSIGTLGTHLVSHAEPWLNLFRDWFSISQKRLNRPVTRFGLSNSQINPLELGILKQYLRICFQSDLSIIQYVRSFCKF